MPAARAPAACGALMMLTALACGGAAHAQEQSRPDTGRGVAPSKPVNTLQDLYAAFAACWRAPDLDEAWTGMEITVMFALTRDGDLLGEPRFTFASRHVPAEVSAIYQRSVVDAFKICIPVPLTKELGAAIAGRPQRLRLIDTRGQKRI